MPIKYPSARAALEGGTHEFPPPPEEPNKTASEAAALDRVTGMDALELGPRKSKAALGGRIWRSAWPKLLAIAIVVLIWQIVVWAQWKPEYVLPGDEKAK